MGRRRRQLRGAHRRVTRAPASGTYHRCHRVTDVTSIASCFDLRQTEVRRMAFCRGLPEYFHQYGPVAVPHRKDLVGDPSQGFGEISRPPPFAGGVDAERVALVGGQRERQEIPRYDHGAPSGIPPSLYKLGWLIHR